MEKDEENTQTLSDFHFDSHFLSDKKLLGRPVLIGLSLNHKKTHTHTKYDAYTLMYHSEITFNFKLRHSCWH